MTTRITGRHLNRAALEQYLTHSSPAAITVPGEPVCHIGFDPLRGELTLQTPHAGEDPPDVAGYEHVRAYVSIVDGRAWSEVTVRYDVNGYEAYLLLSDIVDLVQQNKIPFPAAVRSALSTFQDLVARTGTLTPEKQTGLYGELLFLESCLATGPAEAVVATWKGSSSNEHDFVLPDVCFEIKTTRAERRRHRISGLEQLDPLPEVPLWLVSIQLTSTVPGGGRSLTELVDDVAQAAGPARAVLEAKLAGAGWRLRDRDLYRENLALRSTPKAYPVDGRFPVLNRESLQLGCPLPHLIVDAAYTVDLTSLPHGHPPAPADRFARGDG